MTFVLDDTTNRQDRTVEDIMRAALKISKTKCFLGTEESRERCVRGRNCSCYREAETTFNQS